MTARLSPLLALALLGCPNQDELVVVKFCDLPAANCGPCIGDICAALQEQRWCCPKVGGECTPVDAFTECNASNQYQVWCEIGASVPVTHEGHSGFECYG